mmetsp:Transcript_30706/g.68015  ORF Transcript_30706/g.68015 Transcript_30706/m.68015 type:complete len:793 (+) Transcript_30706:137-2515(+)
MAGIVDISSQAVEAKEQGIQEVLKLLQQPEDLARLSEIRHDYANKLKANRAAMSSVIQSQVDATRHGMDLLERSHKYAEKLRGSLHKIHALCEECSRLVDHQDKIRVLSLTHSNIQKVLSEIEDIVVLPKRAKMVLKLLEDPANLLSAFEALTVLEGTAENAKAAWNRNIKADKYDMSRMNQYLDQVKVAMGEFEKRLWAYVDDFYELAQSDPSILVSCVQVVELQERLDEQYQRTKMDAQRPKRFRNKLFLRLQAWVDKQFVELKEMAEATGHPNKLVKVDRKGNYILEERRDFLNNLIYIKRKTLLGKEEEVLDEEELRGLEFNEEELFDEDEFLEELLDKLYGMELHLTNIYDHVRDCFPPSYDIFDILFQMYHINVASVIDTVGQRAESLSTKGSLQLMEFVRKYMETLRGLGIDEEMVRLPPGPNTDATCKPGLDMLIECYINRMDETVTRWYINILDVDLQYKPKAAPNGNLRTPGAIEFFKILDEEVQVIQSIDDHGEVMFSTVLCAMELMKGFQEAQVKIIRDRTHLGFEMLCAQLNNNIVCYDHSLEFAEEVQELLEEEYAQQVDVEEVCRGFLDVAKLATKRIAEVIFNDDGMATHLKNLYSTPDWLSGRTMATIVETLKDFMRDVHVYVDATFTKRVAEATLEELIRRRVVMFAPGVPQVTEAMISRLRDDEELVGEYYTDFMKAEKLAKYVDMLANIREVLSSTDVGTVVLAYSNMVQVYPSFELQSLQRIIDARDMPKKEAKEVMAQCREIWKERSAAVAAAEGKKAEEAKGWFGWGRK